MVNFKVVIAVVLIVGFLAAGGGKFALDNINKAKTEIGKLKDETQRTFSTNKKMGEKGVG